MEVQPRRGPETALLRQPGQEDPVRGQLLRPRVQDRAEGRDCKAGLRRVGVPDGVLRVGRGQGVDHGQEDKRHSGGAREKGAATT